MTKKSKKPAVETASRTIAFFDFDGTITNKDSLASFLQFVFGKSFYIRILPLVPIVLAFKLQLLSNQKAKEFLLTYFFRGWSIAHFNRICTQFVAKSLPRIIKKTAWAEIQNHKASGSAVVIVSASPENWVQLWCTQHDLECIATKLVAKDGKLTGKIEGLNCHGNEKVKRIKEIYNLSQYEKVYAYGDNEGDKPMMALASQSFYKTFK